MGTVAVTWSYSLIAEAVLTGGVMPKRAFQLGAHYFHLRLAQQLGLQDVPREVLPRFGDRCPPGPLTPAGPKKFTTRCFVWSCEQTTAILAAGGGIAPLVSVPGEVRTALCWLTDAMRILVTSGQSLPASARVAIDHQCGRRRKHRQAVDAGWLAGQVTGVLDGGWAVLRSARGALPEMRPRLAEDDAVFCRCGQPFYDTALGHMGHRMAFGHDAQRG